MSGLFGFTNYDKAGPGIDKNAPKKRTFVVFFEMFFRNFWNFVPINLVYFLIRIPILTSGLSDAGITHVTRNIARDKHSFGLSDFFDTIKKNWKQSLGAGIINTIITLVLALCLWFYLNTKGAMAAFGIGLTLCMIFMFLVMRFYMWTMIITFKLNLKQIYRNSFKFIFLNMKLNLLCGAVLLIVYALYIALFLFTKSNIVLALEIIIWLCTLPAFRSLLIQFCTFPAIKKYMIDPYYAQHPDEDIQKRRDLGLYTEEDDQASGEEDIVFSD